MAIESLNININNNNNIQGIKIPNIKRDFKTILHADDCTNFTRDSSSYKHLQDEFTQFGKASGSTINHDKTEILLIGN